MTSTIAASARSDQSIDQFLGARQGSRRCTENRPLFGIAGIGFQHRGRWKGQSQGQQIRFNRRANGVGVGVGVGVGGLEDEKRETITWKWLRGERELDQSRAEPSGAGFHGLFQKDLGLWYVICDMSQMHERMIDSADPNPRPTLTPHPPPRPTSPTSPTSPPPMTCDGRQYITNRALPPLPLPSPPLLAL